MGYLNDGEGVLYQFNFSAGKVRDENDELPVLCILPIPRNAFLKEKIHKQERVTALIEKYDNCRSIDSAAESLCVNHRLFF